MNQVPLATSSTTVPLDNFWNAVLLHHDRPNLVNRKLAAVTQVLFCEISLDSDSIKRVSDIFTKEALLYEIRKLENLKSITPDFIRRIAEHYDKKVVITESTIEGFKSNFEGIFISIHVLLGRKQHAECFEITIFDKQNKSATFFAVQEQDVEIIAPPFPYHIELTREGHLRIILNSFEDADTNSAEWLGDKFFPKLMKWTEKQLDENIIQSLSLVAADQYYTLYNDLKSKYGKKLVEAWPQKAKTDPQKYVFEEMAIATYLICLWRQLEAVDINFVDCGCGNGLLVYILNQEGYKGYGLDVRRRQIWDLFQVDLRVETVTPCSEFPGVTWIIGNHSDELTPWIPVLALKNSPKTNFFVLPCCCYDFSGQKYVRMDTSKSQYNDYLDYIKTVSLKCGFKISIDKLRIPSTRRICLVGVRENFSHNDSEITDFIESRKNSQFIARKSIEQVRNCTQLDRDLVTRLVNTVVHNLLIKKNFLEESSTGKGWNQGGRLTLQEIIQRIPTEDLKLLKNECGGLQTLLKNHRYIFEVQSGVVTLRPPLSKVENGNYQDKPCWWFKNHPDGCFFDDETCAYHH